MADSPPAPPRPESPSLAKLKAKLRELFQLDRGDLDFGLYRILALRRTEIDRFLEIDLPAQVTDALGDIARADTEAVRAKLDEMIRTAESLGVKPDESPKVKELENYLRAAKDDNELEADTYNHLYMFFSRYYDDGDFMSLRRYKRRGTEPYIIPYNGEEIKFHWANSDQFYIKTTENYASYVFVVEAADVAFRVRFELTKVERGPDTANSSTERRFFVVANEPISIVDGDLVVCFEHRTLRDQEKKRVGARRQEALNREAADAIVAATSTIRPDWSQALVAECASEGGQSSNAILRHLNAYTAKNEFDYFIHKDLGGFLRRELDFYVKNEVVSFTTLMSHSDPHFGARHVRQAKAVVKVATTIILFLEQFEGFQRKLWLKKKFVLDTQYCVTLDRIPEALYAEIAANANQVDEWKSLYEVDFNQGGGGGGGHYRQFEG